MSKFIAAAVLAAAGALGGVIAYQRHQMTALTADREAIRAALEASERRTFEAIPGAPVYVTAWPAIKCDLAWGIPPKVSCAGKTELQVSKEQAAAEAQLTIAGPGVGRRLIELRGDRTRDIPFTWIPKTGKP